MSSKIEIDCLKRQLEDMYLAKRMTVDEISKALNLGRKFIFNSMKRFGIKKRPAVPRIPMTGSRHTNWKGCDAKYAALHTRLQRRRGIADHCEVCKNTETETRYEWANLTGDYPNIDDYKQMCAKCHRNYDAKRRKELKGESSCSICGKVALCKGLCRNHYFSIKEREYRKRRKLNGLKN